MRCGRRGTVRHVAGLLRHSPRAAVSRIGSFEAAGRADLGVLGFQSPPGMRPAASQPSRSKIRRTGRLVTPSMPVSSSALPARPPHLSWCILARISRIGMVGRA